MSAVEERTAEKRPLNDKEDSNEVAVKEPRLENGKTEVSAQSGGARGAGTQSWLTASQLDGGQHAGDRLGDHGGSSTTWRG